MGINCKSFNFRKDQMRMLGLVNWVNLTVEIDGRMKLDRDCLKGLKNVEKKLCRILKWNGSIEEKLEPKTRLPRT